MGSTFFTQPSERGGIASQFNAAATSPGADATHLSSFGEQDFEGIGLGVLSSTPWSQPTQQHHPLAPPSNLGYHSLEQIVHDNRLNAISQNPYQLSTVAPRSVVLRHDEDPYMLDTTDSTQPLSVDAIARLRSMKDYGGLTLPDSLGSRHAGPADAEKEPEFQAQTENIDKSSNLRTQREPIPAVRKKLVLHDYSAPYIPGVSASAVQQAGLQDRVETAEAIALGAPVEPAVVFACAICLRNCPSVSALRHHERTHDVSVTTKHACATCGHGFSYPKDLRRHTRAKHPEAGQVAESFQCPNCDLVYTRNDHLLRHLRSKAHTGSIVSDARPEPNPLVPMRLAVTPRKPSSVRSGRRTSSVNMLSPTQFLRPYNRQLTYAEALAHGHQLSVTSSRSEASQSFTFSQPSSPLPHLGSSSGGTSFDESAIDPQLREGNQYMAKTRSNARGAQRSSATPQSRRGQR